MANQVKSKNVGLAIAIGVGIGMGFAYYQYSHSPNAASSTPPPVATPVAVATPEATPTPSERYPLGKSKSGKPLPTLEESDLTVEEALANLVGKDLFRKFFFQNNIITRFVVTVENAKDSVLPPDLLPFHPLPPRFKVVHQGEQAFIDPKNYERYRPYVALAESIDAKKLAEVYSEFYPLIQAAYQQINSNGYFNDLLIATIDHLMSAPELKEPIEVVEMTKSFQYANKEHEELSASRKILVRMGTENAQKIKAKLAQIRNILILGQ